MPRQRLRSIFQKSVFTKFAHGSRSRRRLGERWSLAPDNWRWRCGGPPCTEDRRSPAFCLLSPLLFFLPRLRRQLTPVASARNRSLQGEPNILETRWKSMGPRRSPALSRKRGSALGNGRHCFSPVVYNAGCSGSCVQLHARVEHER